MKLTVKQIEAAAIKDKVYKLSDGGGLSLQIKPNGVKAFVFRFYLHGKQKDMYLGSFPTLTLKAARQMRDSCKVQLSNGLNPIEEKKARESRLSPDATFEAIYIQWLESKKAEWTPNYCQNVISRVQRMILPLIGKRPIADLEAKDLYEALKQIQEQYSAGLGLKCKQYIHGVFSFALILGLVKRNPATDLSGLLKTAQSQHYAAIIDPAQVGTFLRNIDSYTGSVVVTAALKLTPMLLLRPGELRQLEWHFINWEQKRIEIPAELMKMKIEHIVPLPKQALEILTELYKHTGWKDNSRYVFPSQRGYSRPLSENGVRIAMRSMGYSKEEVTPHGFRATARTLLDEVLNFRVEIIEQQLAHTVRDVHGRAYNRTKHLDQRAEMMQAWADYLTKLVKS